MRHIANGERRKKKSAYRSWAESFKTDVQKALDQWLPSSGYAAGLLLRRSVGGGVLPRRTSASLRDKADQWWYFLDHPEVPPDNNRSERSLRLAVTKRKVCGGESALREGFPPQATANPKGSRSMQGFAQAAILLTVIQTCRAQGRSAFEFFKQALMATASPNELDLPSLIPDAST